MFTIQGKIVFQKISGGFWGIIDNEGKKWLPAFMPEELQKEGLQVEITAQKAENAVSIFMWGTAIEIDEFKILN